MVWPGRSADFHTEREAVWVAIANDILNLNHGTIQRQVARGMGCAKRFSFGPLEVRPPRTRHVSHRISFAPKLQLVRSSQMTGMGSDAEWQLTAGRSPKPDGPLAAPFRTDDSHHQDARKRTFQCPKGS